MEAGLRQNVLRWIAVAAGCIVAAGCRGPRSALGPDSSEASVSGVVVRADARAWRGSPPFGGRVVPVRVDIVNQSDRRVRVALNEFALRGEGQQQARPLPVLKLMGASMTSARAAVPGTWTGMGGPNVKKLFESRGAYLAAPYAEYYQNIPAWRGPFPFDAVFYRAGYARWPGAPSWEMLSSALPEAVVAPEGYLEGYVFFGRPVEDGRRVLSLALDDADSQQRLGVVEVPLR